jgi:hypothetical protein
MDNTRKTHILNEFFVSLLLNDRIVMLADDSFWLYSFFSLGEMRRLFEEELIEIVNTELSHAVIKVSKKNAVLGVSELSGGYVETMEQNLAKISPTKKLNQPGQNILYSIEKNQIIIDKDELKESIIKETDLDLQLKKLRATIRVHSQGIKDIRKADVLKVLNLFHNNRALCVGSILESDNIVLDSNSKSIIHSKLRPSSFRQFFNRSSSVDILQDLLRDKGLPNLGELFLSKIISLDDILELRNDIEGQLFRQWFYSEDYNKENLLKKILNGKDESATVRITNKIRWVIPPIVGILGGAPTGIVAAYANSKFLTKFLNGWHPNLFLDDVLRKSIENKNKQYIKNEGLSLMKKRKQKTGRNEKCPCGSGKKFKYCHGKK